MLIKTTNARGPMARIRARRKTIVVRLTGLEWTMALIALADAWEAGDYALYAQVHQLLANDA